MSIERLVEMANQIGRFFEAQPDRHEAITGIADHLKRFWDPRMREAIVAHLQGGGSGLREIVIEAVKQLVPTN
jgi:formate dehydrogenase subunit delta